MVAQTWEGGGDGEKWTNSKYSLRLGSMSAQRGPRRREVLGVGLGSWPGGKGPQQDAKGPFPYFTALPGPSLAIS